MPASTALERTLVHLIAIPRRLWIKIESRVLASILFGFSVYIATSLISFNPLDPSLYSSSYPLAQITNLAGQYGANIATILFLWLGLSAYLIPIMGFHGANRLISSKAQPGKLGFLLSWLGIILVASFMLQFFAVHWSVGSIVLSAGGIAGKELAATLLKTIGPVGAFILVFTVLTTAVLTNFSFLLGKSKTAFDEIIGSILSIRVRNPFARLFRNKNLRALGLDDDPTIASPANIEIGSQPHINTPPRFEEIPLSTNPELPITTSESFNYAGLDSPAVAEPLEDTGVKTPYAPPPTTIFKKTSTEMTLTPERKAEFERRAGQLVAAFADFNVIGTVASIQPGPVVTVYEFEPDAGTKISKIMGLIDDIALALKVDSVFMLPVRGKRAIGVQVPNESRETVLLGDLVSSNEFRTSLSPLTIAMGKSLTGDPVCADLCAMPHLLTAGATGAGKSVAINALLCSIIMKSTPEEVRLILVDPKMLELSVYEGIPHLLMPVITDPAKASLALKWATFEMERRYRLMQLAKVRHIHGFNKFWNSATEEQKQLIRDDCLDDNVDALPFIVLVIDELADLMLTAPKDVETSIQRLAQKARASGIHLVLATQRPSVDIITGVIKANLPCRIAFQTVSKHDSRTILDQNGADKLLGKGDMLFMRPGTSRLERIQGTFIDDAEVIDLVDNIKANGEAHYDSNIIKWIDKEHAKQSESSASDLDETEDPKYEDAMRIAQTNGAISASFLQRQLKIGYNRAARIVEQMEGRGLVGAPDGSKPREWLGPTL